MICSVVDCMGVWLAGSLAVGRVRWIPKGYQNLLVYTSVPLGRWIAVKARCTKISVAVRLGLDWTVPYQNTRILFMNTRISIKRPSTSELLQREIWWAQGSLRVAFNKIWQGLSKTWPNCSQPPVVNVDKYDNWAFKSSVLVLAWSFALSTYPPRLAVARFQVVAVRDGIQHSTQNA